MTPVFIFAGHVREILASGKKEIEIPEGARVSAAAYDIIRDNKIRIIKVAVEKSAARTEAPEAEDQPAVASESRSVQSSPGPEGSNSETTRTDAGEISEDVLEDIIDRVIERFKQAKGLQAATAPAPADGESEPAADTAQDDDLVICRCEEITRGEIREAIKNGMQTLNGIKRVTRAGMGLCQGQTCQRLVTQIITEELGFAAADIDPTTARGPVRPLRLEVFANS
jgi:bacterioferritin-associated ferredoxin